MIVIMEKGRIRMIFDCDVRMRRAVKLASTEMGLTISGVIAESLEKFIPDHLKRAELSLQKYGEEPKTKRGRKAKGDKE